MLDSFGVSIPPCREVCVGFFAGLYVGPTAKKSFHTT
mgnify:CR=1 FL=1